MSLKKLMKLKNSLDTRLTMMQDYTPELRAMRATVQDIRAEVIRLILEDE